ncbi:MAG: hypothetical protein IKH00_09895 [Bacteroidales bacterium]|jgi:hypothetical protein|nr:hypothetical protein [Bacteroidales bacterium]
MKNISKIIGWVLGILGIVLGIWCLTKGEASNEGPVNLLLRYSYFLLIAAVVILLGLAIIQTARNNPKGLLKALCVIVGVAALVAIAYALASSDPIVSLKKQPDAGTLKLTDTIMKLTYILGGAAIVSIIFGVIRNAINK